MLTSLSIENFKAFRQLNTLSIKPLTILCGTNSCGKSSLLQSILLMKQTFENRTPNQNLLLNGRFVKLGYLQDIIYQKQPDTSVELGFTYRVNLRDRVYFGNREPIHFIVSDIIRFANLSYSEYNADVCELHFSVSVKPVQNAANGTMEQLSSGKILQVRISLKVETQNQWHHVFNLDLSQANNEWYNLKWVAGIGNEVEISDLEVEFENLIPVAFFSDNGKRHFGFNKIPLYRINELLQEIVARFSYIGPLRQSHKDGGGFYFGDDISEIGNWGENAPYLYLKEQNKELYHHFFYQPLTNGFAPQNNLTLQQALDQWLTQMGVAGFSGKISNRIINLQLQAGKFDHTQIDISQVGFGVSQMFPVLLEGLRMEKGGTLLLEQPEIHLHPNLQMQMADFFIAMALSGKHIMAETHSDHLVNRLVRRIVADTNYNLSDLIAIYFVKPTPDGAVCEEIVIDPKKGITNWPTDFFNQHATENLHIIQAGLQKRKNAPIIE